MPVVVEESGEEFPSFSMKKRGQGAKLPRGDTDEFD